MKKEILKAVMDRIRQEVPALRWVDADEGQLDFSDSRPPVAFPAAWWNFPTPMRTTSQPHTRRYNV